MEFQTVHFQDMLLTVILKSRNPVKPSFEFNIVISLKDSQKLDFYEKYRQRKVYETLNNSAFQ